MTLELPHGRNVGPCSLDRSIPSRQQVAFSYPPAAFVCHDSVALTSREFAHSLLNSRIVVERRIVHFGWGYWVGMPGSDSVLNSRFAVECRIVHFGLGQLAVPGCRRNWFQPRPQGLPLDYS